MEKHSPDKTENIVPAHAVADFVLVAVGLIRLFRRRWKIVTLFLLIGLLVGGLHFSSTPRVFESRATVLVTPAGSEQWEAGVRNSRLQELMPTYVKLFGSRVVLEHAAEELSQRPTADRHDLRDIKRAEWPEAISDQFSARAVRRTNLIELAFRSHSAKSAAVALQCMIESYLSFIDRHHRGVASEISLLLDHEREVVMSKMEHKQSQLREVRRRLRSLGLLDKPDAIHPLVSRVMALNQSLIAARSKRLQVSAQRVSLDEALRQGRDLRPQLLKIEPLVGREMVLAALGLDPQSAESMSEVRRQLLVDRAALESADDYYGPAHPKIRELQNRIMQSQAFLQQQSARTATQMATADPKRLGALLQLLLEDRYQTYQAEEQQLAIEYATAEKEAVALNDQRGELQMVEHDLDLLRNMHDAMVNRLAQLDIGQNQADVRIAVVNRPMVSTEPVSPRAATIFPLAAVIGSLLGFLFAYARDLLDDRFRTPEQLQQQTDLPLLSVIGDLPVLSDAGIQRLLVNQPQYSPEAESFRTLRTTLRFRSGNPDSIAVTSAEPGDGKTTVLANLAASLAQGGQRVLVIDGDLRKPALSKLCRMKGRPGLVELMTDPGSIEENVAASIHKSSQPGFEVLPCGRKTADSAELLQRERFPEFIAWAESQYDVVLVDCPPIMAASDGLIIGQYVEGMLVVVQPRKNKRNAVLRTIDRLRALQVPLIGVVANRVAEDQSNEYGVYGYSYSYQSKEAEAVSNDLPDAASESFEQCDAA